MSDTTSDFIYRGHTSAELIDALQRWIRAQGPDLAATTVTGFHHPDHAGFSNVTVTLDLDVRAQPDDAPQADRVAVRLLNEHPFYEGMDLRRQFDHQIRLRDEAGLPVPEMRWFGTDDPALGPQFFAMSFVDGDIPSDIPSYHQEPWLLALTTPEREELWRDALDHLVRLHTTDWHAAGFTFDDADDDEAALVDTLVANRRAQLARLDQADHAPTIGAAIDWLDAHRPSGLGPRRLCWGDARLPNMAFQGARCVAMLDWEDLHLGWPQFDLAWFVFMDAASAAGSGCPRLEGFAAAEPTIARWTEATGLDPVALEWATVYGAAEVATGMALAFASFVAPDQVADTLAGLEASQVFEDLRSRLT